LWSSALKKSGGSWAGGGLRSSAARAIASTWSAGTKDRVLACTSQKPPTQHTCGPHLADVRRCALSVGPNGADGGRRALQGEALHRAVVRCAMLIAVQRLAVGHKVQAAQRPAKLSAAVRELLVHAVGCGNRPSKRRTVACQWAAAVALR
jgi:hypothetical protein